MLRVSEEDRAPQYAWPAVAARAAAGVPVALAVLALAGWCLGQTWLQSLSSGAPPFRPSEALAFVLLGAALWLLLWGAKANAPPWPYRTGQALGLIAAAFGLATFVGYFTGWRLGIDGWAFGAALKSAQAHGSARQSFPATLNEIALGLGLALVEVRIGRLWLSEVLAVTSLQIALVALIGHIFGVPELYGSLAAQPDTGMGLPSAVGFLALSGGLLCSRAGRGLMAVLRSQTSGGKVARRLMLAPALVLLAMGLVFLGLHRVAPGEREIGTWALFITNIVLWTLPLWTTSHALHQADLARDEAERLLEERVRQRTAELSQANAALQAEIAERKQAEAQIHQLNEELEQRVCDRTAQLQAANKELEAFCYSVSHDLRAPLRHIDGFVDLLRRSASDALDEESRFFLATIAGCARQMSRLIDDLLAFSRMGRAEMNQTQVDLGKIAEEAIRAVEQEAQGRSICWNRTLLPSVNADPAMLRQVFINLLSNAVKYTRPREQAEIEIGWMSQNHSEIIVFVRDNGIGFDMQYSGKLFGVFQRLHGGDEFEGTGIGLANVRRIISRHGGRTWAEGKPDAGATFYFSLPVGPLAPMGPAAGPRAPGLALGGAPK